MSRSRRLAWIVLAMIITLASFAIRAGQLPISSCELLAESLTHGGTVYYSILAGWQRIMGPDIQSARFLSLLFFVLTLAFTYKLAAGMFDQRLAIISVAIIGLTEAVSVVFGATTVQGWLGLLTVVSTWLVWQGSPHPLPPSPFTERGNWLVAVAYLGCAGLMVISSWVMLVVVIFQLLYALLVVNKLIFRAWIFVGIIAAIALLKRFVDLHLIGGESFAVQPILIVAWILGVVAVAVAIMDRANKDTIYRVPTILMLWLVVPVVAGIVLQTWNVAMLIVPVLIALVYALSVVTIRARVVLVGVFGVLLLMPATTVSNGRLVADIRASSNPDAPLLVDRVETCDVQDNLITQLYRSQLPFYVDVSGVWIGVAPTHEVDLLYELPESVISAEGQWRIEALDAKDAVADRTLIFQKEYASVRAALYLRQAVEDVPLSRPIIYRAGALALLKFSVQPGNTVSAGSTLIVNSWWTAPTPAPDSYILKVDLVPNGQNAIATDSGLIGKSYTQAWTQDSVHYDQRVLNIPQDAAAGSYNLIISLHGSSNITNLHFDSGDYAYLTTVTITH